MRRTLIILGLALLVLNLAGILFSNSPSSHAKGRWYTNWDLRGTYASQLSGTLVYPTSLPQFAALNGPYCLTGRVEVDGTGNAQGTVYDNYNGVLLHYTWQGTYDVNDDGSLTVATTLSIGGQQYPLVMFGVICDEGKMVRLTQIGPTMGDLKVPGLPSNFLGSAITGSWIRQ
jgi:hypothetical protein